MDDMEARYLPTHSTTQSIKYDMCDELIGASQREVSSLKTRVTRALITKLPNMTCPEDEKQMECPVKMKTTMTTRAVYSC